MATTELQRKLGLGDAVWIGVGSMVGAGVFSAFAPAAEAAGSAVLIGLVIAALVALCNAGSTARLAVAFPRSGGTYLYGREVLGPWWGFAAGWGFVIGKTASCGAMALTVASYVAPGHERPVAAALVVAVTAVNCAGITRTALATRVIVALVLLAIAVVCAAAWTSGAPAPFAGWDARHGLYGVLQAGGLLFFAFAGYARIATLGEEVRDPGRVIPRAVAVALAVAVAVYAAVGLTCLGLLGADGLADSGAPLADAARAAGTDALVPVVGVTAALAGTGALLALGAGIGRTALAMAREGDLPRPLAVVAPRFGTPARAEVVVGLLVVVLVVLADLRGAIGFSSFGVLLYYLVANIAAFRLDRSARVRTRAVGGAIGCVVLGVTLPVSSVLVGAAVVVVGMLFRAVAIRP
ncbi:APA family basic amino acid/polyamine antiporter [Marmoricola sp. OAE513]|uniref:APC family permease n=1 Tax=Marmoricola sp. OAE513 TaxID=2817894 RepID=UPI001D48D055